MIKTYEATFTDKGNETGIFSISLVDNPAYEKYFIALSKQKQDEIKESFIKFNTVDKKERLLVGLVIEPDKPIYRNEDGVEFNVVFKADTIKQVAYNFFKQGFQQNSTIEHDKDKVLKGITFCESWIVRDSKKDIGAYYGMDNPVGSWMVAMKVDDEDIWKDYIETGKVKGFSIDGLVKLKEVAPTKKVEMSIVDKLLETSKNFLIALTAKKEPTKIKFGEIEMEGGEVKFEYEGEVLEAGVRVFAVSPDEPENKIPVPPGTYPLADGRVMIVEEEGIVKEVKEKEGSSHEPPEPEDMQAGDDKDSIQKIQSILIKYEERFKVIDDLAKNVKELKEEVVEFGKKPIDEPSTTHATNIELNKTGEFLELLRANNNHNKN